MVLRSHDQALTTQKIRALSLQSLKLKHMESLGFQRTDTIPEFFKYFAWNRTAKFCSLKGFE